MIKEIILSELGITSTCIYSKRDYCSLFEVSSFFSESHWERTKTRAMLSLADLCKVSLVSTRSIDIFFRLFISVLNFTTGMIALQYLPHNKYDDEYIDNSIDSAIALLIPFHQKLMQPCKYYFRYLLHNGLDIDSTYYFAYNLCLHHSKRQLSISVRIEPKNLNYNPFADLMMFYKERHTN